MRTCEIQIGERRGEANKRSEPKCSLIYAVDRNTSTTYTFSATSSTSSNAGRINTTITSNSINNTSSTNATGKSVRIQHNPCAYNTCKSKSDIILH
jgi:hypothetical protein